MVLRRFLVDRRDDQERLRFERGTLVERSPERIRDTRRLVDYRGVASDTFAYRLSEFRISGIEIVKRYDLENVSRHVALRRLLRVRQFDDRLSFELLLRQVSQHRFKILHDLRSYVRLVWYEHFDFPVPASSVSRLGREQLACRDLRREVRLSLSARSGEYVVLSPADYDTLRP